MPLQRAVVIGCENVLNTFDMFADGEATYSVWYEPKKKYFQPPDKHDYEKAREMLENFVSGFEQANDSTLYSLRIHKPDFRGEVITHSTPYIADFQFRPVELPEDAKNLGIMTGMPIGFRSALAELNGLPQMLKDQQAEIAELKAELEDRDNEPRGIMGAIEDMFTNQQFQGALLGAIGKFMSNFGSVNNSAITLNGMGNNQNSAATQQQPAQVDLADLDESLSRLSRHINLNVDLKKLADFLDANPGKVGLIKSFIE